MSEEEIISALENGGCTKQTIVTDSVKEYKEKISKAQTMNDRFRELAQEIQSKINELVQKDKELAKQLKGLVS